MILIQLCLEWISTLCPGALFSIHIPISTKNNNNKKEINNKIDKGLKIQKVLYLKCNRIL